MISPISIKPEPKNNKARHVFFACLGSAILVMVLYMLLPKFKGVAGVVALGFITAAIYVYNRYVCAVYFYDVTVDYNDNEIFVIRQIIGKRETTLCRVDLTSIQNVRALTREEMKKYKPARDTSRYAYYPTLSPDVVHLIEVRSSYEKADVFVELTEDQARTISAYAAEAREISEI